MTILSIKTIWVVQIENGMVLPGTRTDAPSEAILRAERLTGRKWDHLEREGYTCVLDMPGLPCRPLVPEE